MTRHAVMDFAIRFMYLNDWGEWLDQLEKRHAVMDFAIMRFMQLKDRGECPDQHRGRILLWIIDFGICGFMDLGDRGGCPDQGKR